MVDHDGEILRKVEKIDSTVADIRVDVAKLNGKVDQLTSRFDDSTGYVERQIQQSSRLLEDRMNIEGRRSDERHQGHEDAISGIGTRLDGVIADRIAPLEAEADASRDFRNKLIGIALGSAFGGGAMGGGIVALVFKVLGHG